MARVEGYRPIKLIGDEVSFINYNDGRGTGLIGKIISIVKTCFDLVGGLFDGRDVAGNYGRILQSSDSNYYLKSKFSEEKYQHFELIANFAINDFEGLTKMDIDALKNGLASFYQDETKSKLVIPLILPKLTTLEEKHMVLIFIDKNDHSIEYFDAKGVTSEHRSLKNGMMKNVLEELAHKMQNCAGERYGRKIHENENQQPPPESPTIKENARVFQLDCHNCGAYTSWFAIERLKRSAEEIVKGSPPDLRNFRARMKPRVIEYREKLNNQFNETKPGQVISADDF